MAPILPGNYSQRLHRPGDIDDCWCAASIWAYAASNPAHGPLPDIPHFRAKAGDPDDGHTDGGSLDEVMAGLRGCFPDAPLTRYQNTSWAPFVASLKRGGRASLAVWAGHLPANLQFGFTGAHQVGVAYEDGLYVANPLAPEGSPPIRCDEAKLHVAAESMYAHGEIRAAIVRQRVGGVRAGAWAQYTLVNGTWHRARKLTSGFTAHVDPPTWQDVRDERKKMCRILTGGYAGTWFVLERSLPDPKGGPNKAVTVRGTFYRELG